MPAFDVNMDKVIGFTAKLERLHRSAFPVAVRQTLNGAAFAAKKNLPITAKTAFKKSNRPGLTNFVRAFSTVEKANGWNIKSMKATVGIRHNTKKEVVDGLVKQELGGTLERSKLLPHMKSRTSGSYNKRVKKKHRKNKIDIVSGNPSRRRSRKSNIVAQAYIAAQTGKHLLVKKNKGGKHGTVFEVKGLRYKGRGAHRSVKFRVTPIFVYRENTKSKIKATPFVRPAAQMASKKMPEIFEKEANKQFKRLLK